MRSKRRIQGKGGKEKESNENLKVHRYGRQYGGGNDNENGG